MNISEIIKTLRNKKVLFLHQNNLKSLYKFYMSKLNIKILIKNALIEFKIL
jgi:hypothetical protein